MFSSNPIGTAGEAARTRVRDYWKGGGGGGLHLSAFAKKCRSCRETETLIHHVAAAPAAGSTRHKGNKWVMCREGHFRCTTGFDLEI